MKTNIINLTPHDIVIVGGGADGWEDQPCHSGPYEARTIPASGQVARVSEQVADLPAVDGIPTVEMRPGDVTGLSGPVRDTIYIVSPFVAAACPGRGDVYCPDTGPDSVVRDNTGQIIGVRRLRRIGDVT